MKSIFDNGKKNCAYEYTCRVDIRNQQNEVL